MAKSAKLQEIFDTLATGGILRFTWASGNVELIDPRGASKPVDGRSYHSFGCDGHDKAYVLREEGDTEKGNLVMEWSLN
jgi:hypothetical protein